MMSFLSAPRRATAALVLLLLPLPSIFAQLDTLYNTAKTVPDFFTFMTAVDLAGLESVLNDPNTNATLLVPENEAFENMSGKYLEAEWEPYLRALVAYHVISSGKFFASDLSLNATYPTLFDDRALVLTEDDPLTFNEEAMVINGNQEASNGVIHTVNSLLLPDHAGLSLLEQATTAPQFSRFVDLIVQLNLTETLDTEGPWTILMPTDDAFSKIPSAIFNGLSEDALTQIALYHVIPSIQFAYTDTATATFSTMHGTSIKLFAGGVMTADPNGQELLLAEFDATQKDMMASNGVWHAIDTVLIPIAREATPATLDPTLTTTNTMAPSAAVTSTTEVNATFTTAPSATPSVVVAPTATPAVATPAPSMVPAEPTILDVIKRFETLSDLQDALELVDLDQALNEPGDYTLFAPINSAFNAMPIKLYSPAWKLHLEAFLLYHLLGDSAIETSDLAVGVELTTVEGSTLEVTETDPTVVLNGNAQITVEDTVASNGVLHIMNRLLLPPYVTTNVGQVTAAMENLSILTGLLNDNNLMAALAVEGPITLLAPVDSSFSKVPISVILDDMSDEARVQVLSYHVIPQLITTKQMVNGATFTTLNGATVTIMNVTVGDASQLRINDASIVQANTLANNGIIHFIDTVLIPFLGEQEETTTDATDNATEVVRMTILEILDNNEEFSTLAQALRITGLDAPLSDGGPFTVFAPNDFAFGSLPSDLMDGLSPEQLTSVLTYHVVPGIYLLDDLVANLELTTVQGSTITITSSFESTIMDPNIMASNGVVHIVDVVLIPTDINLSPASVPTTAPTPMGFDDMPLSPPMELQSLAELVANDADYSTLFGFLGDSGVGSTIDMDGPWTVFGPNNAAFSSLPTFIFVGLEGEALVQLLSYHVVPGSYLTSDLYEGLSLQTLQGSNITVTSMDPPQLMDDNGATADVILTDTMASNGVFYGLDNVLLPSSAAATDEPTETPIVVTDVPTLPPTTVLATEVPETDSPTDALVLATTNPTSAPMSNETTNAMTVMDVVIGTSSLSTLASLLDAAGLNETLVGPGPFSIFAPVDSGFDALPEGFLDGLTDDDVMEILLYHVVPGTYYLADLSAGASLPTAQGSSLTFSANPLLINNASQWIGGDFAANNGVVHLIADVLVVAKDVGRDTPDGNQVPECDDLIAAYAAVCCPIENPAFQAFCQDLFDRRNTALKVEPGS